MKEPLVSLLCCCVLVGRLTPASTLAQDGSIVAWGHNGNGQCNVPPPNGDFVAVVGALCTVSA
jgi:hypothetical protein